MRRAARLSWCLLLALVLLSGWCGAWGTLTQRLPMTEKENKDLCWLICLNGGREGADKEIEPRRGPHPTHQFIVKQAYLLLDKDPAVKDSPWQLPALESVLNWDGIEKLSYGTYKHQK